MKKILVEVLCWLIELKNWLINDIMLKPIKPKIISSKETVKLIIDGRYSISRFGDGEFALIFGRNLKFQQYSTTIRDELKRILRSKESNLLIGIPDIFGNNLLYTSSARNYWDKYLHSNRNRIYKVLNLKKQYYDSLMTRFYMDYADKAGANEKIILLKKIWDGRKVLIVEGKKSRLGMGNDLFCNADSIERLICPSENAYEKIDIIQSLIEMKKDDTDLVLIALGPTATCLSHRLFKKGIQAVDIGHIDIEYEWFLDGASKKKPVSGKYIGEIPDGDLVGDKTDDLYRQQIWRIVE